MKWYTKELQKIKAQEKAKQAGKKEEKPSARSYGVQKKQGIKGTNFRSPVAESKLKRPKTDIGR
ncbi:MAG: hypothetical protein KBD15_02165 [Candidatus Magasanikbacteria bacterium]|jgi:hypothetical protein|nr:hypothetical protein [Candidatus Magasanikbacteria bacterium]